jgi:hypothetical protein
VSLLDRRLDHTTAALLACSARLGAHLAVLELLPMTLALSSADPARQLAAAQQGHGELLLERRLSREGLGGRLAQVGAVLVQANAAHECSNVILEQASVGAADTGLGAIEAGLDARNDRVDVEWHLLRMRLEHASGVTRQECGVSFDDWHDDSLRCGLLPMCKPASRRGRLQAPPRRRHASQPKGTNARQRFDATVAPASRGFGGRERGRCRGLARGFRGRRGGWRRWSRSAGRGRA